MSGANNYSIFFLESYSIMLFDSFPDPSPSLKNLGHSNAYLKIVRIYFHVSRHNQTNLV